MVDLVALKTEIDTDPLARGYAAMSDAAVAADMNLVNRPVPIVSLDAVKYLAIVNKWGVMSDAADKEASGPKRIKARNFIDILDKFETIDMSDAAVSQAVNDRLDELVADSFISTADKAVILGLGDNKQSRGDELGLGFIRHGHVTAARALV